MGYCTQCVANGAQNQTCVNTVNVRNTHIPRWLILRGTCRRTQDPDAARAPFVASFRPFLLIATGSRPTYCTAVSNVYTNVCNANSVTRSRTIARGLDCTNAVCRFFLSFFLSFFPFVRSSRKTYEVEFPRT